MSLLTQNNTRNVRPLYHYLDTTILILPGEIEAKLLENDLWKLNNHEINDVNRELINYWLYDLAT